MHKTAQNLKFLVWAMVNWTYLPFHHILRLYPACRFSSTEGISPKNDLQFITHTTFFRHHYKWPDKNQWMKFTLERFHLMKFLSSFGPIMCKVFAFGENIWLSANFSTIIHLRLIKVNIRLTKDVKLLRLAPNMWLLALSDVSMILLKSLAYF